MTIQWFPGHMAKARRQVEERLKLIDIVFELLDARIPSASQNPMMDEIVGHKPRIILLNKYDLADPAVTKEWVSFFERKGGHALPIDSLSGRGLEM
ncbi:MAG: ribosome biogenesis GTPase YlqF, partial [Thermicanus sp.]|nr:ribosome biogenesis GTPase YlqF [Thermicanus sp.]